MGCSRRAQIVRDNYFLRAQDDANVGGLDRFWLRVILRVGMLQRHWAGRESFSAAVGTISANSLQCRTYICHPTGYSHPRRGRVGLVHETGTPQGARFTQCRRWLPPPTSTPSVTGTESSAQLPIGKVTCTPAVDLQLNEIGVAGLMVEVVVDTANTLAKHGPPFWVVVQFAIIFSCRPGHREMMIPLAPSTGHFLYAATVPVVVS